MNPHCVWVVARQDYGSLAMANQNAIPLAGQVECKILAHSANGPDGSLMTLHKRVYLWLL